MRYCTYRDGILQNFTDADTKDDWWNAAVPGDIHIDCIREALIPDPFFGTNQDNCIWMEEKDWWYRFDFLAPEWKSNQRVILLFEGLDTFATIFLNGTEIGCHQNMFTPVRIEITEKLIPGTNRLAVCLSSPIFSVDIDRSPGVSGNPIHRLFTRKAQACYGWDIAPRLVTCGIWKPVSLIVVDELEIANVEIRTINVLDKLAEMEVSIDILKHSETLIEQVVELTIDNQTINIPFSCNSSFTTITHQFIINNPKLWWPHNHGIPNLYDYTIRLKSGEKIIDETKCHFGIRTIQLIQESQEDGKTSFFFKINEKPIFLKGMNWTPADAIYTRIDHERYSKLILAAVDANINAFRVWGGGIYESDYFYDLCDQYGILVWQDFMFACGCYPQDEKFLIEVHEEAEYIVRRLRLHPCLLIFCGDNENDWLAPLFGVPDYQFSPLSKKILPEIIHRLSPEIPYVPSSPFSLSIEDQNSPLEGDIHLWAHGTSYASDFYTACHPRMVTEIGHIAMPDMDIIRTFIKEDDLWPIWNESWLMHSADPLRVGWGIKRLKSMFDSIKERGWEEPSTLEDLIKKTQQLQAEATFTWIKHFSSDPECWGIFLWNLADCWPQVSDAYIAYPFNPKPAFAVVKEEYSKISR
jgi:beta-mannosidase